MEAAADVMQAEKQHVRAHPAAFAVGSGDRSTGRPAIRDLARRGSRRFPRKPDYVQLVGSTGQVVEAVQDAVRKQLRVAVRSGRHCLEAFVADPAVRVVIDTSLIKILTSQP